MDSKAFRRAVVTLLVSTTVTLACAAPSHASWLGQRRAFDDSTPFEHTRSFVAALVWRFLELAGGAMDPNGVQ